MPPLVLLVIGRLCFSSNRLSTTFENLILTEFTLSETMASMGSSSSTCVNCRHVNKSHDANGHSNTHVDDLDMCARGQSHLNLDAEVASVVLKHGLLCLRVFNPGALLRIGLPVLQGHVHLLLHLLPEPRLQNAAHCVWFKVELGAVPNAASLAGQVRVQPAGVVQPERVVRRKDSALRTVGRGCAAAGGRVGGGRRRGGQRGSVAAGKRCWWWQRRTKELERCSSGRGETRAGRTTRLLVMRAASCAGRVARVRPAEKALIRGWRAGRAGWQLREASSAKLRLADRPPAVLVVLLGERAPTFVLCVSS